ncbi:unnamed protein product [Amoebophrya sp. A120]|nr:unnamed protein product [Amoebophrya sp. A120]|eukprot:GSA120T00011712001.1
MLKRVLIQCLLWKDRRSIALCPKKTHDKQRASFAFQYIHTFNFDVGKMILRGLLFWCFSLQFRRFVLLRRYFLYEIWTFFVFYQKFSSCYSVPAAQAQEQIMIHFGPHAVRKSSIFFESSLSYGLVNLKPIVPGHVLVIPKRIAARFKELSTDEVTDLYQSVHKISSVLEPHFQASGLNIAQQDGPAAGQSVPHVHVHILPREAADFEKPDQVHEEIERAKVMDDTFSEDNRRVRTQEEMAQEATELAQLFPDEYRPK